MTTRLAARFPDASPGAVADVVNRVHRTFDGRPIRDFVPVLVEQAAKDELAAMIGRT